MAIFPKYFRFRMETFSNSKVVKSIVLLLICSSFFVLGCKKDASKASTARTPKQAAERFIQLELKHKYRQAYKEFYPKNVIGGYKGFIGTSKRVFKDYEKYKFVKEKLKKQYLFELSNRKSKRLIFIEVVGPFSDQFYIGFGEYQKPPKDLSWQKGQKPRPY